MKDGHSFLKNRGKDKVCCLTLGLLISILLSFVDPKPFSDSKSIKTLWKAKGFSKIYSYWFFFLKFSKLSERFLKWHIRWERIFQKHLAFCEFSPDFQSENGFDLTKKNWNEGFPTVQRKNVLTPSNFQGRLESWDAMLHKEIFKTKISYTTTPLY